MGTVVTALRTVLGRRRYLALAAVSLLVALPLYLMTLPAVFTGGRIGPAAMRFLNPELTAFSVVMALLMGLLVPLVVFLVKQGRAAAKASATGGVLAGVAVPLLCCSPALPIAMSFLAGFFPALVGAFGWKIQGFIATHQTEIFIAATALLGVAVYQNARAVVRGPSCELPRAGPLPAAGGSVANGVNR